MIYLIATVPRERERDGRFVMSFNRRPLLARRPVMSSNRRSERAPITQAEKNVINSRLRDQLKEYNDRDHEAINRHRQTVRQALEQDDDVIRILFGGSVERHTYVEGSSDVDALAFLNRSKLSSLPPQDAIKYMRKVIRRRLPNTKIRTGDLAVTVKYSDGVEMQFLPAIERKNGIRIADPSRKRWSNVIHPDRFRAKLTKVNQARRGQVIPAIKLMKGLANKAIPNKNERITGYHMESIAIEAFRAYQGPTDLRSMVIHTSASRRPRSFWSLSGTPQGNPTTWIITWDARKARVAGGLPESSRKCSTVSAHAERLDTWTDCSATKPSGKTRIVDMKAGYILIAGSASEGCDGERLARALQFVRDATTAILDTGNSVSVLATYEPTRIENGLEAPIAFDWEVLRTVERYVLNQPGGKAGRVLVRAATGADSETKRFSDPNRQLIRRLQDMEALEIRYIPEAVYSGGDYRNYLLDMSDGMIAVGGCKGTYITGDMMLAAGKPVMPMDIRIGAIHEDGEGALKLLAEMKSDPKPFLPRRHEIVKRGLSTLSLEGARPPVLRIANEVADILKAELEYQRFLELRRDPMAKAMRDGYENPALGMEYEEKPANLDLATIINGGESDAVEFKATLRTNLHTQKNDPRMETAVLKTLAGFLNTHGGTLIVGVRDDRTPIGIEADRFASEDKMLLHLTNLVNRCMGEGTWIWIRAEFEDHDDVRVLVIRCEKSSVPVYSKEENDENFYIRTGPSTVALPISQLSEYIKNRF